MSGSGRRSWRSNFPRSVSRNARADAVITHVYVGLKVLVKRFLTPIRPNGQLTSGASSVAWRSIQAVHRS
jgi:hypothetical protein